MTKTHEEKATNRREKKTITTSTEQQRTRKKSRTSHRKSDVVLVISTGNLFGSCLIYRLCKFIYFRNSFQSCATKMMMLSLCVFPFLCISFSFGFVCRDFFFFFSFMFFEMFVLKMCIVEHDARMFPLDSSLQTHMCGVSYMKIKRMLIYFKSEGI